MIQDVRLLHPQKRSRTIQSKRRRTVRGFEENDQELGQRQQTAKGGFFIPARFNWPPRSLGTGLERIPVCRQLH
jgi:hypothetical protein